MSIVIRSWISLSLNFVAVSFGLLRPCSALLQGAQPNTLKMGIEDSIQSYDPRQIVDTNSLHLEELIHCSLITFDSAGQAVSGIASQLPLWKTPTTLEVSLRKNVKFADGLPLTATDVAATYQSFITNRGLARSAAFAHLKSVQVIDSKTLTFTLKEADASFISSLVVGILPSNIKVLAGYNPIAHPGCGPYKIKSKDGDGLLLEANPHYSTPNKLRLKLIEIKIVKNERTRVAKLQSGELDLVQNSMSQSALRTLEKTNTQLMILKRPGLQTTYLGFNIRDKLAGNPAVREAIAHAINRQEIIDLILGGMATPATTMLTQGSPYYAKNLQQRPMNLAKAGRLLDEAGFKKKGEYRFELTYKTSTDLTKMSIAKAIAAQLKKIGIKITIESMEEGRFRQDIDEGRVQLWSLTWIGFKDPDIFRHALASSSFPPNGGNRGWYSNAKLDQLLELGKTHNEPNKRIKIYQDAQTLIDQELPYIFLWHEDNFAVVNRLLKGFVLDADSGYSSLTQAFFAE